MRTFLITTAFLFPFAASADICARHIPAVAEGERVSTTNIEKLAQPFTVTSSCTVTDVGVILKKEGSPASDLQVSIWTGATEPTSLVANGSNILRSGLTTTYAWATSTFSSPVLSSGTTYWLQLTSASIDDTNYYWWQAYNSPAPYGTLRRYSSSSWVNLDPGYNIAFQVVSPTSAAATAPSILGLVRAWWFW